MTTLMKKLISEVISILEVHFSSFQSNPVLSATSVFSPSTWPSDSSALVSFGYDQICQLSTHFSHTLQQRGYTPESCVDEWPELKLRVQESCSIEPTLQYLTMWQNILKESKTSHLLPTDIQHIKRLLYYQKHSLCCLDLHYSMFALSWPLSKLQ